MSVLFPPGPLLKPVGGLWTSTLLPAALALTMGAMTKPAASKARHTSRGSLRVTAPPRNAEALRRRSEIAVSRSGVRSTTLGSSRPWVIPPAAGAGGGVKEGQQ